MTFNIRSTSQALSALLVIGLISACGQIRDHDDKPVVVQPKQSENQPCPQKLESRFTAIKEAQTKWYAEHGAAQPTEANQAKLKVGKGDHAVMLVHGFISSPEAMEDLAKELAKSGDTVYSALLTGYGSDPKGANDASTDDWRQTITDGYAMLKLCYPKVTIVAHSLGGALVTEAVQKNKLDGVEKIVMLAPYYKLEQPWPTILVEALAGGIPDLDVETLQAKSGTDPYGYLPLKRPKPGEQAPFLPLRAMKKVIDLQEEFGDAPPAKPELRALLVESESDPVINGGFAAQYLNKITPNLERITYEKDEKVGHSIQDRDVNPHFDEMARKIQDFIEKD